MCNWTKQVGKKYVRFVASIHLFPGGHRRMCAPQRVAAELMMFSLLWAFVTVFHASNVACKHNTCISVSLSAFIRLCCSDIQLQSFIDLQEPRFASPSHQAPFPFGWNSMSPACCFRIQVKGSVHIWGMSVPWYRKREVEPCKGPYHFHVDPGHALPLPCTS